MELPHFPYPLTLTASELAQTPHRKEWLLTASDGTYASQSVDGSNDRKYHGLLVANGGSPSSRYVLLSRLEESLQINGIKIFLSSQRFKNSEPSAELLEEVTVGDTVRMRYQFDASTIGEAALGVVIIEKTIEIFASAVQVSYLLISVVPVEMCIRPLVAMRFYHWLRSKTDGFISAPLSTSGNSYSISHPDVPLGLTLTHNTGEVTLAPENYWDLKYIHEEERGYDSVENCYSPYEVKILLIPGKYFQFAGSVGAFEFRSPFIEAEKSLDAKALLTKASSKCLSSRDGEPTIIAGYPWFVDWGRDSMISLPGLLLSTGKLETAQAVLRVLAKNSQAGVIPNCFADGDVPIKYNSVDGTLWFAVASYLFSKAGGNEVFVQTELYPVLCQALEFFTSGSNPDMYRANSGLLWAGSEETQLTWMDAAVGGVPVTPRYGYPVEIQALWYNFLRIIEYLAEKYNDEATAKQCKGFAGFAKISFKNILFDPVSNRLADVATQDWKDLTDRPNVFIALSLPFDVLDVETSKKVFERAKYACTCEAGVMSLGKGDPRFQATYRGEQAVRDAAYHQGTIWPWLTGPFFRAAKKFGTPQMQKHAEEMVANQIKTIGDLGIGGISELREASPPYLPCGAPYQAWSVAELLRCLD